MRTEGIKVKITLPIQFDKPDLNGVVHNREAVNQALRHLGKDTPLLFRSNEDDEPKLVGCINDTFQMAEWDNENGICKLTVNGIIYYGGMDINVNGCHKDLNGEIVVDDFEIKSFGFSM